MDEKENQIKEDISKEIEKTVLQQEKIISEGMAKKEEQIAKNVAKIPIAKDELEERKKKIISFLKQKKDWAYYLILSIISNF